MDFINKVELKGIVGSVKSFTAGYANHDDFTLVTEEVFTSRDGANIVEVTWHNCRWTRASNEPGVKANDIVHLWGKIYTKAYADKDGNNKVTRIIVVDHLQKEERG